VHFYVPSLRSTFVLEAKSSKNLAFHGFTAHFWIGITRDKRICFAKRFFSREAIFFKKKQEQKGWGCRASQVGAATSRGFLRNVVAYL
jgi:hypothetical protein